MNDASLRNQRGGTNVSNAEIIRGVWRTRFHRTSKSFSSRECQH
jgi:hypothetical protein